MSRTGPAQEAAKKGGSRKDLLSMECLAKLWTTARQALFLTTGSSDFLSLVVLLFVCDRKRECGALAFSR